MLYPIKIKFTDIESTSVNISWHQLTDVKTLVLCSADNTIDYPINGLTYTFSSIYDSAPDLLSNTNCNATQSGTASSGWKIVYDGAKNNVTVLNLSAATTYNFILFNHVNTDYLKCDTILYSTTTGVSKEKNGLSIKVVDYISKLPVIGATVTITNKFNNIINTGYTNATGNFNSAHLEEGLYNISVTNSAYIDFVKKGVYNRTVINEYSYDTQSILDTDTKGRTPYENRGIYFIQRSGNVYIYMNRKS